MKNKSIKIFSAVLLVIVGILGSLYYVTAKQDFYGQFTHIKANDLFNQKEEEYQVYYYMKDCGDCMAIKENFESYISNNKDMPIYLVDMNKKSNKHAWYDWKDHHSKYDKEIGEVDSSGKEVFYDGESRGKYEKLDKVNKSGFKEEYEIVIANKDYLHQNKNASINKIYAQSNAPILETDTTDVNKIEIAGVPTLIHVKGNQIEGYYYDKEVGEYFKKN